MSSNLRVTGRKDSDIREFAKKLRSYFGIESHEHIDVLGCLKRTRILTCAGRERVIYKEKNLRYEVVKNDVMPPGEDAFTRHEEELVTIVLKEQVEHSARMGDGRSRNTISHELGHAMMHGGGHMPRRVLELVTPNWVEAYRDPEHQVKIFAPAFLIDDTIAKNLDSAEEISVRFGVSYSSAQIYWEGLLSERNRAKSVARVRKIAEDFADEQKKDILNTHYINTPCTACGKQMLFPVGCKFLCDECGNVSDGFQDGDIVL